MTRLDKALRSKGLTGAMVSRKLEVGEASVSKWRRGLMYVPQKHREPLAELVEVPAEELFDDRGIAK